MNSNKLKTLADLGFEEVDQSALLKPRPRRELMDVTPSLGETLKDFRSRITVRNVVGFIIAFVVAYGFFVIGLGF